MLQLTNVLQFCKLHLFILIMLLLFYSNASQASDKNSRHNNHANSVTKIYHKKISSRQTHQIANNATVANRARIVELVNQTIQNLNYNKYKLGGSHFDPLHGVYIVDCSSFVDHLLAKVNRPAYRSLVHASGVTYPNTLNYFQFFNQINNKKNIYWSKVEAVNKLQAGDILVFRKKSWPNATGHIMVVMKKPVGKTDTYQVRVADSAPFRHSQDTRMPHVTGIGIGTLLLKVNPKTGKPFAYAWTKGSFWEHNIHFAMARPLEKMKLK